MVERKIIEEKVRKFVKELKKEKIRITKVILYGSRVSGKAHEYSKIDVAIVSPVVAKEDVFERVGTQ